MKIEAQAQKEANELLNISLSDAVLEKQWIEKWNGKLPTYYGGDEEETLVSQGIFVNAWMPLTAPFREDMQQAKQTNGDRIRSMNDEELAEFIPCPYDTAGDYIMPCLLGERKGNPTKEECHECMMKWLEREAK